MTEKKNDYDCFALESAAAMMERVSRRLWIVIVILLLALIISNAVWLYICL